MFKRFSKKDWIIIAVITVIYSAIALFRLGDFRAPNSFYSTEMGQDIVIDLGNTTNVKKMSVFFGVGWDTNYGLYASDDLENWESVPLWDSEHTNIREDSSVSQTYVSVFKWDEYYIDVTARYICLTTSRAGSLIGEIGLWDADGNLVSFSSELAAVGDEQDLVPARSTFMNSSYFDEIYHPRTAYEITNEISPFETTHPPLGKVIIAVGMSIFGFSPFGWRIMGTLMGIIMLPLFYALCLKIFKKSFMAGAATTLFAADFMHFSLTRIGTIDSFSLFFILLIYLFLWDYFELDLKETPVKKSVVPLIWTGVFFGLGGATKWICLYSALGIAAIWIYKWVMEFLRYRKNKKKYADFTNKFARTVGVSVVAFVVIPAMIYFLSYLPQARYNLKPDENVVHYVVQNQKSMFSYHNTVTDPHPYASKWTSWIVTGRPLFAYIDSPLRAQDTISSISIFGNPAIWWLGAVCVLGAIYLGIRKRDKIVIFFLVGYFGQLLPWVGISRPLFIYHYFSCVPFIICAIVYCAGQFKRYREILIGVCAVSIVLFIAFYPILSGFAIPRGYANMLKWFDSWTFF